MSKRPTAQELAEAIEEFLSGEILPTVADPRLRFRTLVALNALGHRAARAREAAAGETTPSSGSLRRGSAPATSRPARSRA